MVSLKKKKNKARAFERKAPKGFSVWLLFFLTWDGAPHFLWGGLYLPDNAVLQFNEQCHKEDMMG